MKISAEKNNNVDNGDSIVVRASSSSIASEITEPLLIAKVTNDYSIIYYVFPTKICVSSLYNNTSF